MTQVNITTVMEKIKTLLDAGLSVTPEPIVEVNSAYTAYNTQGNKIFIFPDTYNNQDKISGALGGGTNPRTYTVGIMIICVSYDGLIPTAAANVLALHADALEVLKANRTLANVQNAQVFNFLPGGFGTAFRDTNATGNYKSATIPIEVIFRS